jgi:hypothetical protein
MTVKSITEQARPILLSYGVKSAALFGSHARGEARRGSDVDILVSLKSGSSLLDLIGLQQALGKRLKTKVDLVTSGSLHPRIRQYIKADLKTIV